MNDPMSPMQQPADPSPQGEDSYSLEQLLQFLTPERVQSMSGMAGLQDKNAMLQQQLAQAEALRQPRGERHSEGLGAALGGVGDILRQIKGQMQESSLNDEMKANLAGIQKGRDVSWAAKMAEMKARADALRGAEPTGNGPISSRPQMLPMGGGSPQRQAQAGPEADVLAPLTLSLAPKKQRSFFPYSWE